MHDLLVRQLRKVFGDKPVEGEATETLLRAISDAYQAADENRKMMERSLYLASEELLERSRRLDQESADRQRLQLELGMVEQWRAIDQVTGSFAHEINTPAQFLSDSLQFLQRAFAEMGGSLVIYQQAADALAKHDISPEQTELLLAKIAGLQELVDMPFLQSEIPLALARCDQGLDRMMRVVRALKDSAKAIDQVRSKSSSVTTA